MTTPISSTRIIPIPIRSLPGIKRDGTRFDGKNYVDGQWVRFQRGLPRKIFGYRSVTNQMAEKVYGINSFSVNATQYMHLGSASLLTQRRINNSGVQTGFNDRTPGGLAATPNNIWQMDAIFEVGLGDTAIVANAAPNMDIASDDAQPIWYGLLTGAGLLTDTGMTPVSGGVVTVGNYLVSYGSGGYVQWNTTANNLTAAFDEDFVTPQKIVKGLTVRGGGVPAALLFSLDSLLIMTLNPTGTPFWDFDTIGEISVLSSRGMIEYDGVYYWPGVDRFLSYNGVIREVPNTMNQNYFYDNLNFEQRQKVFSFKVPRFGEIWWCYPHGVGQVECNHAVIYNVRENTWYDTALPNSGRSDGIYARVYFKPFMTGVDLGGAGYTLWQHETGVDQVVGSVVEPIPSHFETSELSLMDSEQNPSNSSISVGIMEPDFVQAGELTMRVRGRANARSEELDGELHTIVETATNAAEQLTRLKDTKRLMSFRFGSNTPGGNYEMGNVVASIQPADKRQTQ